MEFRNATFQEIIILIIHAYLFPCHLCKIYNMLWTLKLLFTSVSHCVKLQQQAQNFIYITYLFLLCETTEYCIFFSLCLDIFGFVFFVYWSFDFHMFDCCL
jgi:hypothetical protein